MDYSDSSVHSNECLQTYVEVYTADKALWLCKSYRGFPGRRYSIPDVIINQSVRFSYTYLLDIF